MGKPRPTLRSRKVAAAKRCRALAVAAAARPRSCAIVVDGGYYAAVVQRHGLRRDIMKKFVDQIRERVGCDVAHVTYLDSDAQDYLLGNVEDGLLGWDDVRALGTSGAFRDRATEELKASLGANMLEVQLAGLTRRPFRVLRPPKGTQETCTYMHTEALGQSSTDVAACVRLVEYAHGLVRTASGVSVAPTDIVLLGKDGDLAPAMALVAKTSNVKTWLCAMRDFPMLDDPEVSPQEKEKAATGVLLTRICRSLEAFIPVSRRMILSYRPTRQVYY